MAYIITSKTRARISRQPTERAKMLSDLREKSKEKHGVYTVTPTGESSEEEIHQEFDKEGHKIQEVMDANREHQKEETKKKQKERKEKAEKVIKERLNIVEERDRRSGLMEKVKENTKKMRKK